ncbi:UDP-N-acetylglucosamine pyrophosphorylase /glucosamine-1-phosphate N-acetyltransferase [Hasllibacter halocynthiae]|uniref:Bifunctional protein GlmU n=1 Tax=Hasllibacter halocynthiae TaxID=595589 RepID=A0A2T0X7U9_9RHOB|nr:bifunctional UDP-N-acetylglucosamine diphosphorylase/glucosamine-1-phosphate N-acetyltransferase GlmU [Hasllibacter halocynthiae]PRY95018.1 UDP-N-acetylglucosamine pyrophosphorylase /glucosamine-1-phosphate N-acetyltransferase [Hasllibacter halocynthiae]
MGARETALIILAAGAGTRMRSALPKVLHEVAGAPLLHHAMRGGAALGPARTVVVTGHDADLVAASARLVDPRADVVHQPERKGTAHAVAQAAPVLAGFGGDAVVLYADTPFVTAATLRRMVRARDGGADLVVLGFEAADPGRYGRLVTDGDELLDIVEYADADERQRAITLCNSGVVMGPAPLLLELVAAVGNDNAAGEHYLTDIPAIARRRGWSARVVRCEEVETMGVNSRLDLAAAERTFQDAARLRALDEGVTLVAPETVHFAYDTALAPDVTVEPNVVFRPGVRVEGGAVIRAFSHLEGCTVAPGAVIGPFARLRLGAEIGPNARVGNFSEVKKATLGEGAKVNHLSYVGDAEVGPRANLGAGTVTCNYDGVHKHRTVVGADAFVGSSSMLVAPVTVGEGAVVGSGSVVTEDVPPGDLALGRGRQVNKAGRGAALMARLRQSKRPS